MIISQPDDRFKLMRKYIKSYIGTRAAVAPHAAAQEMEGRYFLARTLEDPSSVIQQIRRYEIRPPNTCSASLKIHSCRSAGSIFLKLSYGYTMDISKPDTLVGIIESAEVTVEWLIERMPLRSFVFVFSASPAMLTPYYSALPTELVPWKTFQKIWESAD